MNFLSSLFSAVAKVFGFATQRDAEKNTAVMQAAAADKQEQAQVDTATKAVATQNTTEVRNELAE